jgi:hypothetical protein
MHCTQGVGSVIEDTKRCIVLKSEQKAGSLTLPARTILFPLVFFNSLRSYRLRAFEPTCQKSQCPPALAECYLASRFS